MNNAPSMVLWAYMLRPWPYRLLILGILVSPLALLPPRPAQVELIPPLNAKRFGMALFGGQIIALLATILFVSWSFRWKFNPRPELLEVWTAAPWRFYSESICSELGLLLSVFVLIQAGAATWGSIGMHRSDKRMPWLIALVGACYIILRFAIKPLTMSASHWVAVAFVHHSTGGDQGADSTQLGLSMVLEAIRQAGPWTCAMVVLWMGLLAPIIEELFYRGLVLKAL